jgi:hypothetical protein
MEPSSRLRWPVWKAEGRKKFFASEYLNDSRIRIYEQVFLDGWTRTVLQGLLSSVASLCCWGEYFYNQARIADSIP